MTPNQCNQAPALRWLSPTWGFVLFLAILGGYRFTLIGKGHFYWADEGCYLPAANLVDAVSAGHWRDAIESLFVAPRPVPPARPGFVVLGVIPTIAQRVTNPWLGISPQTPASFDVVAGFNVLVSLAVTICVYAIGMLWTRSRAYSLLLAVVYSLLVNANVWICHLVPYQVSLLCFLLALWLISWIAQSGKSQIGGMMVAGFLTAWGYACYPGHYAFVVINAAAALGSMLTRTRERDGPQRFVDSRRVAPLCEWSRPWRRVSTVILAFGGSCLAVIAGLEGLSRLVGRSYLHDLAALSGSVTMGDSREGFNFIWRYLRDVEGPVGVALFVLFFDFILRRWGRRSTSLPPVARAAILAAVACYLLHASASFLLGRLVWYGRVLSVYLPFLVTGGIIALMQVRRPGVRRVGVSFLLAASIVSFLRFAVGYHRITYPAEFLQKSMGSTGRDIVYPSNILWGYIGGDLSETVEAFDPRIVNVVDTMADGCDNYVRFASFAKARASGAEFIGVNLEWSRYVRKAYEAFDPPPGYRLLAEAPHPDRFPAHQYEGRKPWERTRLHDRPLTLRLYQREDGRTADSHAKP